MYLIVRLLGNREEQKRFHYDLREPILRLFENGTIKRFVLTYHYKGKESDNLHLCMDIPILSECSMKALISNKKLKDISDYLTQELSQTRIEIGDYEHEVRDSTLVDKASNGSAAALKILAEGPDGIDDWKSLKKKIIAYCGPFVVDGTDAAHYCLNSLGTSNAEELNVRAQYPSIPFLDRMIHRLFNRESWVLQ